MTIFHPVDMMGPAHRGAQVQQLAQTAAANVVRRNRMKALLAQGARGARASGASQPLRNSLNGRALSGRGATLRGLAAMLAGRSNGGGDSRFQQDDGAYGAGGGGYDYPSIPDPTDPRQSPVGAGPSSQWPVPQGVGQNTTGAVNSSPLDGNGAPTQNPDGSAMSAGNDMGVHMGGWGGAAAPAPYGGQENDPTGTGLIHLGNGMYYDPATDSVRGGGAGR